MISRWLVIVLLATVLLVVVCACTITGDVKYKTSDGVKSNPVRHEIISDDIGSSMSHFARFVKDLGLAAACPFVMDCYKVRD
jgi:hypothetical protein